MDLDIYLAGRLIAHSEPASRGAKVRIVYEGRVDTDYPAETSLLSCSIPTGSRSEPAAAQSFLEGLLPEGNALQLMAAALPGVSLDGDSPRHPYDAVNLLGEYGRECAGAVSVVPRGDPAPGSSAEYKPLDADDVAELISGLPSRPLGVDVDRDVRMSLAGAQPKLLLALIGERWQDPIGGAPSTHILKPTGRWVLSSDNECVVMTLARDVGLTRSSVWVESFAGRRALVAQRFDREVDGLQVGRVHQEDLCQAAKVRPKDKYKIGRLSDKGRLLIRDKSSDPTRDVRELFRQMAFRAIVGDEDGHAKNYGFMLSNGAVSLAPMYDSLTTLAYSELTGKMGAPIGRQHYLAKVDIDALVEEGQAFRFGEKEACDIVESLALSIRDGLDNLNPDLADERAMDVVTNIIRTRTQRLLDGKPMGGVESRYLSGPTTTGKHYETLDQATLVEPADPLFSPAPRGRRPAGQIAQIEHRRPGMNLSGAPVRGSVGR